MKSAGKEQHGVPLGGIGTGAVELCADGRFRNISINNNRLPETHIAKAGQTFAAIRIASAEGVYARILQHAAEGVVEEEYGAPPRMRRELLHWRGAYPAVHYKVKDAECPAEVVWTAFAPFIPFDYDASTMPAVFFSVRAVNPTEEPLAVSAVLNWENVCGWTGTHVPQAPSRIMPLMVEEQEEGESLKPPAPAPDGARLFNAVEFGSPRETYTNAHGHYCLAARRRNDIDKITVFAWDSDSPEDQEVFWERFLAHGDLARCVSRRPEKRSGAVCCSFQLPPKQERRADFVLTWFCPLHEVNGVNGGNGYTNKFANAVDVARKGLRHLVYFFTAVEAWQKRIQYSSLPPWLSRLLISHMQVFCTNAFHARDGRVSFMESPHRPCMGRSDTRLYASLGALLFFPRFEENELLQIARAKRNAQPGRLCGALGTAGEFEPGFDASEAGQVVRCAHFVLSVYRNYVLTGSLPRLQELLPAARAAMATASALDRDRDGIPDAEESETYDGVKTAGLNSHVSGLWVAAVRAYAKLAGSQGLMGDAVRYDEMGKKAAESFERLFWDETGGYYRLGRDASETGCHTAQLAGQWYADFLGLGALFNQDRIHRALDGILLHLPKSPEHTAPGTGEKGFADEVWPGFDAAHLACLLIYWGRTEDALRLLEQYSIAFNYQQCSPYNFPDKWNPGKNALAPDSVGRHSSVFSLWHVLYAVEGLQVNVPEQSLRVTPRLFPGWHTLNAPIFTPACLGWLQYTEEVMGSYRQQVHVSFDSPVKVNTIELCVPARVDDVQVRCEDADGIVSITHRLLPGGHVKRVIITARQAITVLNALSISLEARS